MSWTMVCDGCGRVMNQDGNRLRLTVLAAGRPPLDLTPQPSHDFCQPGCLATWAVEQEALIIQEMNG